MAQSVYSVRFLHALGGVPGPNLDYIVPAGYTAIVRDVDAYSSAGITNSEIYLQGDLGQAIWHGEVIATTKANAQWRGRQVYNAGETISINFANGTWDVTVSGYLLVA